MIKVDASEKDSSRNIRHTTEHLPIWKLQHVFPTFNQSSVIVAAYEDFIAGVLLFFVSCKHALGNPANPSMKRRYAVS